MQRVLFPLQQLLGIHLKSFLQAFIGESFKKDLADQDRTEDRKHSRNACISKSLLKQSLRVQYITEVSQGHFFTRKIWCWNGFFLAIHVSWESWKTPLPQAGVQHYDGLNEDQCCKTLLGSTCAIIQTIQIQEKIYSPSF